MSAIQVKREKLCIAAQRETLKLLKLINNIHGNIALKPDNRFKDDSPACCLGMGWMGLTVGDVEFVAQNNSNVIADLTVMPIMNMNDDVKLVVVDDKHYELHVHVDDYDKGSLFAYETLLGVINNSVRKEFSKELGVEVH